MYRTKIVEPGVMMVVVVVIWYLTHGVHLVYTPVHRCTTGLSACSLASLGSLHLQIPGSTLIPEFLF